MLIRNNQSPSRSILAKTYTSLLCFITLAAMYLLARSVNTPKVDQLGFDLLAFSPDGWFAEHSRGVMLICGLSLGLSMLAFGIVLFRARAWQDILVLVTGSAGIYVTAQALKITVDRARPLEAVINAGGLSFPSTVAAYSISVVVAAIAISRVTLGRGQRVAALIFGCSLVFIIGCTMVGFQVHYLTDVIAGWALGGMIFLICSIAAILLVTLANKRIRP